ncbi:SigE family RNA polymerase sigma factor [Nocardioides sp. C4-1]|uniref:SigE family RNA polymerase sigma factor n=1 Tax=Nocardioides sp. C4-1 TaxID=3151851 RepID=UPI0032638180
MSTDHRAGFEPFVRARERRWLRTAHALTGDWHRAQDLVQSVLVSLYVDWRKVERAGDPDAYVHRCLVNRHIDEGRRPWRRERLTFDADAPPEPVVEDVAARAHEHDELVSALRSLPPGQRAVLVLRYLEDLDVEQTAAVLGCSAGTVKSQTSRGLVALRALLPAASRTSRGDQR